MPILIISERESDLSSILMNSAECRLLSFSKAADEPLNEYSALAILCGTEEGRPKVLPARLRMKIDEFVNSGKPVFYEWCASFAQTYTVGDDYNDGSDSTGDAMNRYVYVGKNSNELTYGDLLDSQANLGCIYRYIPEDAIPILYNGGHVLKHDHVDACDIDLSAVETRKWRLWYYDKTQLVSSFRLCNFVRARFAPFNAWCDILEIIAKHLGIENVKKPKPHYTLGHNEGVMGTFRRAMMWFDGCNILVDEGRDGASEGMSHPIYPDGRQAERRNVRVDCIGEVAGAYLFDHILNGKDESLDIYKRLSDFIFDKMQVKSGKFKGMLRWTETAWNVTYGDDTGRALLATLLYITFTEDKTRLGEICAALDFLITITGSDGLMEHGVSCHSLTDEVIERMHSTPSNQYCAHRNAYYSAALLLAYRLCGKEIYLETALKGLSSIMNVFPNTMRAISETEELCRLIFPLSCLYEVTKDKKHLDWLYSVADRLELYKHKSGAYVEMDPGYTAYRSRTAGTESSMLADNGNEIADLLYSLNWLPLGFSYAYYVTGDPVFLKKWEDISDFFSKAQIVSDNKTINGAWSRSLDLNRMEIYGMPHDVGWGPCCIESGWTVGEILMGIGFGTAVKRGIYPKI